MRTNAVTFCVSFLTVILGQPCLAIDRYVSPTGGNLAPFTSWSDAATNIQDAIDAVS